MTVSRLTTRALNRALLARQLLLEPAAMPTLEAVEHLGGLQAQEPQAPYLGLWSRLAGFDPAELSAHLDARRTVRASLMRWTIHLVTAEDYQRLWPLMRNVLARGFRGSPFSKQLGSAAVEEVVSAGHELLCARPLSRTELGAALTERFPDGDPASLAVAATVLAAAVQVPPRGLWRRGGQARWAPAAAWLGREVDGRPDAEWLVRRYLAAFGPATVRDVQSWSGLTRLSPVLGHLRADLRVLYDEQGHELFDLPDAPLPDPDTPAPPRLLAPFDNAILGHADRLRIVPPEARARIVRDRLMRTFLLDGFVAGGWRIEAGELALEAFRPLSARECAELEAEAERAAALLGAAGVRIVEP